jgi:hypothetical protein
VSVFAGDGFLYGTKLGLADEVWASRYGVLGCRLILDETAGITTLGLADVVGDCVEPLLGIPLIVGKSVDMKLGTFTGELGLSLGITVEAELLVGWTDGM